MLSFFLNFGYLPKNKKNYFKFNNQQIFLFDISELGSKLCSGYLCLWIVLFEISKPCINGIPGYTHVITITAHHVLWDQGAGSVKQLCDSG